MRQTTLNKPEREIIENINFAPELLPLLNNPKEIQDLKDVQEAEKADMEGWIETAEQILPEICMSPEIDQNLHHQI